jgi:hypothetical protein
MHSDDPENSHFEWFSNGGQVRAGSTGAAGGTGPGDAERSGTRAGNETVACADEGESCADADCCERLRCFQGVCGSR